MRFAKFISRAPKSSTPFKYALNIDHRDSTLPFSVSKVLPPFLVGVASGSAVEVPSMSLRLGPAGPTLSDVLGSSAALPEATPTKKGGSTFDTLNGNVLAR